jgi:hypothetical protein
MTVVKKAVILGILGFLELMFISWAIAPTVPHRSVELKEFAKYQDAPTDENKEIWLRERRRTRNEVMLRRAVGGGLGFGNLFLIAWAIRRRS